MVWLLAAGRWRRPLQAVGSQVQSTRALSASRKSRVRKTTENDKSEWWVVDGEMHEIGDNVPPRERFVIPRDNIPNKRRKQLREQFMRRTRLVLKDSVEHEPWCKKYMELYQELRENWERLYWDEGYSKKHAQDRAAYDSAEDDNQDFSPYSRRQPHAEETKNHTFGRNRQQGDSMEKVGIIRDKFEFDRQRRMRDKAFAPMWFTAPDPDSSSRNQMIQRDIFHPVTATKSKIH